MATTHKHVRVSPARRRTRSALVLGLATASAIAFLPGGSSVADPVPTLAEVQSRAAALDLKVEQAVEDYQEAQVALEGLRVKAAAAEAEVSRQRQAVAGLQAEVGDVVAAAYRNGTAGTGLQLLTQSSSPQAYLDKATSLDQLAASQAARLAEVMTARTRLDTAVRQATADLTAQQRIEQEAAAHRQAVEADLAASQALLNSLQAEQRAQLAAARAAADAAAAPVPAAPARASRDRAATPPAASPTYTGQASGRAAIAVQEAYNKLGSRYVWAASGPSTFDCSGLTAWVWAKAGVSLPHSSRMQYASTRHVAQSDVQPGDLLFFGSPTITHVGIYVGNGNMIAAPRTGDVVKVSPAFRSNFVGASRP
ncbi:MAG TPA: NlpC/P60 family protein [Mycobacteriales bacterium]|nr:NlpC/P60 family protein [Mycobacteriales bacterium]